MSLLGGRWVRFDDPKTHSCERRLPKILGGIVPTKVGAQWECDCGHRWEIKAHPLSATWQDVPGMRPERPTLYWSDTGYVPNRTEVVERMLATIPPEAQAKADFPGDDVLRLVFLVALLSLDRLKLGGDWRKD